MVRVSHSPIGSAEDLPRIGVAAQRDVGGLVRSVRGDGSDGSSAVTRCGHFGVATPA